MLFAPWLYDLFRIISSQYCNDPPADAWLFYPNGRSVAGGWANPPRCGGEVRRRHADWRDAGSEEHQQSLQRGRATMVRFRVRVRNSCELADSLTGTFTSEPSRPCKTQTRPTQPRTSRSPVRCLTVSLSTALFLTMSGIHGQPYMAWSGGGPQSGADAGYCPHNVRCC